MIYLARLKLAERLWGKDTSRLKDVDTSCLDLDFVQDKYESACEKHGLPEGEAWGN